MKTLTADDAATYVGCISAAQFRREVRQGVWPAPIAPRSRPQRWSVAQLDAALAPKESASRTPREMTELELRLGILPK
jgi:hypothetical protein